MAGCCIVYATDAAYLLPTLVSAVQARRHASPDLADVAIHCVGEDDARVAAAAEICAGAGVLFRHHPPWLRAGFPSQLARFLLAGLAGDAYTDVLYLDGDTQVLGSLDPLIRLQLGEGELAGVRDPLTFLDRAHTPDRTQANWDRLGIGQQALSSYVNAGVQRASRATLEALSRRCFDAWLAAPERYLYLDQDVLNTVHRDHIRTLPLRWNFPGYLYAYSGYRRVDPVIVHFMARVKPWAGVSYPWGRRFVAPYEALMRDWPALGRPAGPVQQATRTLHQAARQHGRFGFWGGQAMREKVLAAKADHDPR